MLKFGLFTNSVSGTGLVTNSGSWTLNPGTYWVATMCAAGPTYGFTSVGFNMEAVGLGYGSDMSAGAFKFFGGQAVGQANGSGGLRIVSPGTASVVFPTNDLSAFPMANGAGFDAGSASPTVLLK